MNDYTEGYASAMAWIRGKYPDYEIRDASQPLEIEVTYADILIGDRKNPFNCAISEACRREDGADIAIVIRSVAILVYHKDKRAVRYQLAGRNAKILREYDQVGSIEPTRIWLAATWPTNRIGSGERRRRYESNGNGKSKSVGPVKYIDGVRNWRRPAA